MPQKHHIVRLEIRYRPSGTEGAWSYVTDLDPKADSFHLMESDVEIGKEYEIQARQWNDCGLASDWTALLHTVVGGTDAPWAITGVDDFRVADGIRFKLTFDHTGKLPAGVFIQAHKAPDVSGAPGAFVDTGKTYGPSNTFTIDDDGSVTSWYKFRTIDQRSNVSEFSSSISSRGKVVADGADVTLDQIDGDGNDVLPARYAVFVGNKIPKIAQSHNLTATLTTAGGSTAQFAQSLRLTVTGTAGEIDIDFASAVNKANIPLQPNSKWNYTCQVKSSVAGRTFVPRLVDGSGTVLASGGTVTVPNAMTVEGPSVINLSADATKLAFLRLRLTGGGWAVGNTLDINWQLVERKVGNATKQASRTQPGAATLDEVPGSSLDVVRAAGLTADNVIDLSLGSQSSPTGVETIANLNTAYLNDGANLGVTADATGISNLPPSTSTAAALGLMTNAQPNIGIGAAVKQILRSDGGAADWYWDDQYHGESDARAMADTDFIPSGSYTATGAMAQIGNKWVIPNPGTDVVVIGFFNVEGSSTGTGDNLRSRVDISSDGGSTFVVGTQIGVARMDVASRQISCGQVVAVFAGTPTGDIHVKAMVQQQAGANTVTVSSGSASFGYMVFKTGKGNIVGSASLTSSIPATSSKSCSAVYPTTTCMISSTINVTAAGGLPGYTYSNVVVSATGSGSVTSGATAASYTVADTETTADGPSWATFTTTVKSTVTDAETYTATNATWAASVATLTIGAHTIAVNQLATVQHITPSGYNGSNLVVTAITGTAIKYAVAVNPGAFSSAGAAPNVINVSAVSSNCVVTGTFKRTYAAVANNITGNLNPTNGVCAGISGTSSTTLTNHPTGGDLSFTYSNVKTSGSGSVASGATSASFVAQSPSSVPPNSWSGVFKGTVTDGHSSSANQSKTVNWSITSLSGC